MRKKHIILAVSVLLLSICHFLLSIYYLKMYGYFNRIDALNSFVLTTQLFRVIACALPAICGFIALQDKQKKLLVFHLAFFLSNLLLMFLFTAG